MADNLTLWPARTTALSNGRHLCRPKPNAALFGSVSATQRGLFNNNRLAGGSKVGYPRHPEYHFGPQ